MPVRVAMRALPGFCGTQRLSAERTRRTLELVSCDATMKDPDFCPPGRAAGELLELVHSAYRVAAFAKSDNLLGGFGRESGEARHEDLASCTARSTVGPVADVGPGEFVVRVGLV